MGWYSTPVRRVLAVTLLAAAVVVAAAVHGDVSGTLPSIVLACVLLAASCAALLLPGAGGAVSYGASVAAAVIYLHLRLNGTLCFLPPFIALVRMAADARPRVSVPVGAAGAVALILAGRHLEVDIEWAVIWLLAGALGGAAIQVRRDHREAERKEAVERDRRSRDALEARHLEERVRLARDLHDILGHSLAVISVHAAAAAASLDRDPEDARASLRTIAEVTSTTVDQLGKELAAMREASPRPLPSLQAYDQLLAPLRHAGIRIDASVCPVGSGPAEAAAYRILQEALTNIARHGQGVTSVRIRVARHLGCLGLVVADDGQPSAAAPGGGIAGMKERAGALGGRATVAPRPGGGVMVRAVLPEGRP